MLPFVSALYRYACTPWVRWHTCGSAYSSHSHCTRVKTKNAYDPFLFSLSVVHPPAGLPAGRPAGLPAGTPFAFGYWRLLVHSGAFHHVYSHPTLFKCTCGLSVSGKINYAENEPGKCR